MEAIKKVKDFPYCRETRESASLTRFSNRVWDSFHFLPLLAVWGSTAATALPYFAKAGSASPGAADVPSPKVLSPFHSGNQPGALSSVAWGNGWSGVAV